MWRSSTARLAHTCSRYNSSHSIILISFADSTISRVTAAVPSEASSIFACAGFTSLPTRPVRTSVSSMTASPAAPAPPAYTMSVAMPAITDTSACRHMGK